MKYIKKIVVLLIPGIIFFLYDFNIKAESSEDYSIAYINDYEGECLIKRKGQDIAEVIMDIYLPLYEGDSVITELGSRAEIVFDDATLIKLDPNSSIVIKDLKKGKNNKTLLDLLKGKVIAIVKKLTVDEEFTIKTKLAAAAVKGTEFIVEAGDEERVGVYDGKVEVASVDMDGNILHKIILDKDKETKIVKKLKIPEKPKNLGRDFIKRYKEIKDLRKKIEFVREMRNKGEIKKYKLKRRIERIENLKKIMNNNPNKFKSLTPKQKKLIDKMMQLEPYYRKQIEDMERKEIKEKRKIKLIKQLDKIKKEGEK